MAKLLSKESEWKKLLLAIGNNLRKKNVDDIIFLKEIEAGIAEKVSHSGLMTLKELERREVISHRNPGDLLQILIDIKRHDLKKLVEDFQSKFDEGEMDVKKSLGSNNSELWMRSSPRGICLILSNEKFDHSCIEKDTDLNKDASEKPDSKTSSQKSNEYDRPGTLADENALEETFRWLGFKVRLEKNHTADEMYKILNDIANEDHSKYDAFVCCILSHGGKHQIYGTDWKSLKIQEISDLFKERVCETLGNKPKIFLVQACRGKDIDAGLKKHAPVESSEGSNHPNDSRSPGLGFDFSYTENNTGKMVCSPESDAPSELQTFDEGPSDKQGCSVPGRTIHGRNIMFVFAAVEGYKAILHDENGSWLIRAVCDVLQQSAFQFDLQYMLHQVQTRISAQVSYYKGRYKTTVEFDGSLDYTKIYFQPSMTFDEYRKREWKGSAAK